MKRLLRSEKDRLLAVELYGHAYYHNPKSTAALRGRRLVEDHGLPEVYDDWSGYDLGRAGISAINLGCDGYAPCRELGGMTPIDAIRRASDVIGENGHTAQAAFFEMTSLLPDALKGDAGKVYERTSEIRQRVHQSMGPLWLIDDQHAVLRAIVHYEISGRGIEQAVGGQRVDLEQARQYVDRLSPWFKCRRGIEYTKINQIIDATDCFMN